MIYFIECVTTPYVKIGYAKDTAAVARRLIDLQIGSPFNLRVVEVFDGVRADEKAAHRCLRRSSVRGEWFHRGPAMSFMRAARIVGISSAASSFNRWNDNEDRVLALRRSQKDAALSLVFVRLAEHVLCTIPVNQIQPVTGLTRRAWDKTARGQTKPHGRTLFNSLTYAPQFVNRALQFGYSARLSPIAEADRLRVQA